MPLTYEKYQKLQALLADPKKEFSDEARERAQAAIEAYQNDYSARAQGIDKRDHLAGNPLAMPAEEPMESPLLSVGSAPTSRSVTSAPQAAPNPDEAKVQQLVSSLDPSLSLPAQALAAQPATTHPGGDEAAKDEWIRGDLNNPKGLVVAYEMPVSEARKKLLEKPELFRALQLSVPPTPEAVMSIQEGDSTHQALNDYYWREAAKAAAESGKTIYRRAKAPWLGDGKGASTLDALRTKYDTMSPDAPTAFVLGFDDTANFGAGKAMQESGSSTLKRVLGGFSDEDAAKLGAKRRPLPFETTGGVSEGLSVQERNDQLEESHPAAHTLGQALGMLAPWTVANKLWGWVAGEGVEVAAKGALRGAASGLARGGAAGAVDQAAREGVQAASSYAATGDSGTTLGDAAQRIGGAAAAPAALGAVGRGLRGLGNQLTEGVRWGDRYDGAPGRVEAHGIEPRFGKGHVAPDVVKEAEMRGRKEGGRSPLTVLASDLDEPLADAANYRASDVERVAEEKAAEHYASPEGGHTLPMRNLVETAAAKLRGLTSEVKQGLKGVGKPRSESPVKDIFNANIEGVSTRKTKNGVPLSAKEARSFLSPEWQAKLDLDKLEAKNATVYVTPRRYDSQHADEAIDQLGKSTHEDVADIYDAAIKDREQRGGGAWAKSKDALDQATEEARGNIKRIRAQKPGGVRRTVEAVGKSKGEHQATPALRDAARRAGGDAPEKLRGALVAEDLGALKNWSTLGGRNPLSSPLSLWGLTDKAVLKGVYPAARKLEKLPEGGAKLAGRAGETVTRNVMDDRADERRKERDEKSAEGYRERAKEAGAGKRQRLKERKPTSRRRTQSNEANQ